MIADHCQQKWGAAVRIARLNSGASGEGVGNTIKFSRRGG